MWMLKPPVTLGHLLITGDSEHRRWVSKSGGHAGQEVRSQPSAVPAQRLCSAVASQKASMRKGIVLAGQYRGDVTEYEEGGSCPDHCVHRKSCTKVWDINSLYLQSGKPQARNFLLKKAPAEASVILLWRVGLSTHFDTQEITIWDSILQAV